MIQIQLANDTYPTLPKSKSNSKSIPTHANQNEILDCWYYNWILRLLWHPNCDIDIRFHWNVKRAYAKKLHLLLIDDSTALHSGFNLLDSIAPFTANAVCWFLVIQWAIDCHQQFLLIQWPIDYHINGPLLKLIATMDFKCNDFFGRQAHCVKQLQRHVPISISWWMTIRRWCCYE